MLRGEEYYLNEIYVLLSSLTSKKDIKDVLKYIKNNSLPSLQHLYIDKDLEYLKEINYILSIITSIVSKPLLISSTNEIIVRSGQASALSNDDFLKTSQDSSLWKKRKDGYIPEKVYFKEYIDEIKTYENRLIVELINVLSREIDNYLYFYASLIKRLNTSNVDLKEDKEKEDILLLINRINSKLLAIKSTYFYKVINKDGKRINNVVATNILLDNRLYNRAFRFYKEMLTYGDNKKINLMLLHYYYLLFISTLIKEGYKCEINKKEQFTYNNELSFDSSHFKANLSLIRDKYISLELFNKDINHSEKILINVEHDLNELHFDDDLSTHSLNYISIYKYGYMEEGKLYTSSLDTLKEEEMIKDILLSYTQIIEGSKTIYSKFCPICKSKEIDYKDKDDIYICEDCKSEYVLKDNKIYFMKIRRNYGREG